MSGQRSAEEAYKAAATQSDPMSQKLRQFATQVRSVDHSQQRVIQRVQASQRGLRRRGRRRRRRWYRPSKLRRTQSEPPLNCRRGRRGRARRRRVPMEAAIEVAAQISGNATPQGAGGDPRDAEPREIEPQERYTMATGLYMTSLTDDEDDRRAAEPSASRSSLVPADDDEEPEGGDGRGVSWLDFLREAGAAEKEEREAKREGGEAVSWSDFLREMSEQRQQQ